MPHRLFDPTAGGAHTQTTPLHWPAVRRKYNDDGTKSGEMKSVSEASQSAQIAAVYYYIVSSVYGGARAIYMSAPRNKVTAIVPIYFQKGNTRRM